jgi:signal transduction histidine kinase
VNSLDHPFRILVIDDDDVDRLAVRRLLKRSNFDADIEEASTGGMALKLSVSREFECILLDFHLSDMDGLEFLSRMADAHPGDIPAIVILTGEGDETIAVNAMKAGAQDYLVKAVMNADILIRTIISAHEKVSLRREIDQKSIALERSNRAKSEFLANMSHELRTPLNAIIGFAQIMEEEIEGPVGNPNYVNFISHIHESGRHLLDVINDILDLSKIEAGQHEITNEEVDIKDAVTRCTGIMLTRSQASEVPIIHDLPDLMPNLWIDQRKLKQVLLNLLSNAVKFTPAGGTVTIKAANEFAGGFSIQIIDTGIGLSQDDIPKAMAPFGQIDSSLSRNFDGTGLGLPLSKSFIELQGGSLELESAVDVGTTVTIRFPEKCVMLPDIEERSTVA